MDINATIDVGDNVTGMLERLAQQLGTTADKVFPWYVQQAHLEGVTTLVALGVCLVVFGTILALAARKADFEEFLVANVVAVASGAALALTILVTALAGTESVRQVMNPNYYAMKMMTQDIGRLMRK